MKKMIFMAITALFATMMLSTNAIAQEGKSALTARQVIDSIDSSKWKVNPLDYGMTAMQYQMAEAAIFAKGMQSRTSINQFYHFPGLSKASDTWVVTPNNDTIYSIAVVDARKGFSVTLPEVGDRFISLQVHDQYHTFVDYNWTTGTHTYNGDQIDTDYVFVGIRIATTATTEDIKYITEILQPQIIIKSNSAIPFKTNVKEEDIKKLRKALLVEWSNLDNMYDTVAFDIHDVSDWERWTYTIAGSWGLSPESTAMYASWAPKDTKGNQCYQATFDKVPAKAFASLTVYNDKNYLMSDDYNVVSTTRPNFKSSKDGKFTIIFGGMDCKSIADKMGVNFAYTPDDGWKAQLRSYRPDVEAMKHYVLPEIKTISSK